MPVINFNRLIVNPYSVTLLSWLCLIALAWLYPTKFFVYGTIILTVVLPFLLAFIWLTRSAVGKLGADILEKWHWGVISALALFVYAIFAKQWAAVTINHIFHVDASYLSITTTAVAALYLPLQFIYNLTFIFPFWIVTIIISVFWVYTICCLLIMKVKFWKISVAAGSAVIFIFSSNFFFTVITNMVRDRDIVIMNFALWADFNSDHLCSNDWAKEADSVLFLGGDWVLAHKPTALMGKKLVPVRCDFTKSL